MTAGELAQPDPGHLAHARRVADAILYEGYLLYPYRQSAVKNQARFQFGVLMPPGYAAVDPHESAASQTECLLECGEDAQVTVVARFLQFQDRIVQAISPETGELHEVGALYVDGFEHTTWNEAAEREQRVTVAVGTVLAADQELEFTLPAGEAAEPVTDGAGRPAGQLVRRWEALDGAIALHAERAAGPYQVLRLRIRLENRSRPARLAARDDGLRHALIAAHLLVGAPGGRFLSLTDPPEWASAAVAQCENAGTWPVLAGPPECADLLLSSPVILYDHPEVAAESAGDLFDATEIDEILTLRTLALTDAEKREARSTDSRAADLLDRLDHLPPEMLDRMHGAIRYLRSVPGQPRAPEHTGEPPVFATPDTPWWDPGADSSVSPDTDHVVVAGHRVARGSRVLMRPGSRRADAQDLFLAGREAQVEAVLHDVDGQVHLAVTPVDDPAADLQRSHGRFLYFAPDEVEPLGPRGSHPGEHSQAMGLGGEEDQ
ncbi:MAG TPA: hypothetical protein VFX25_04795 [Streptosporangiaceae bacterium]|nr:hypothetical protein [Streptosporangiaceae bacterium]